MYCLDGLFEDAFGGEDELDRVAGCAVAAFVRRDVVSGSFDLFAGVGDGDGESADAHDGQVDDVVADVGDFVERRGFPSP